MCAVVKQRATEIVTPTDEQLWEKRSAKWLAKEMVGLCPSYV
jgi:hypothetical protein